MSLRRDHRVQHHIARAQRDGGRYGQRDRTPTTFSSLTSLTPTGQHVIRPGADVTVLEALDQAGGRARVFRRDGFSWDAGPTVITAPYLLEELTTAPELWTQKSYLARAVTAEGLSEIVPLATLDDIVFGGWDIFEEDCYAAAKTAGVLEPALLELVRARALP